MQNKIAGLIGLLRESDFSIIPVPAKQTGKFYYKQNIYY